MTTAFFHYLYLTANTIQHLRPITRTAEVRQILEDQGFAWKQGSVYFGDPNKVNAVTCVLTAQRLASELPWFSKCVRDIRMLRIEENNDLS